MTSCLAPLAACLALVTGSHLPAMRSTAVHSPPTPVADTSWVSSSALYEVFIQDFSARGDLRGVIEGLDRIQSTGANVIWLMPVHPIGVVNRKGKLGSPYAAMDYRAINPSYGSATDFKALVEAAHDRDMKVILDWVPDHTSADHPWITQHPDWYFRNDKGKPSTPRDPDGKLTDWTDVAQLDFSKPALRQEMISTMQWWLTEFNLDGFRVDVAGFVPYAFWREALPAIRGTVPRRLLMLAEWGDMELHRLGYDLTYAWDSNDRLKAVWKGGPASVFVDKEVEDMKKMPAGGARMRFTTNHDQTAWDDPPTTIFGRGAGTRAAYVAATMLPGRPLLYNGQEVESPQKLPLFERELVQWDQPGGDSARAFYTRVIAIARTNPAILSGEMRAVKTSAPTDLIAYGRGNAVILVNPRSRAQTVTVTGLELKGMADLLSGRRMRSSRVDLPAFGALVLQRPSQ